METAFKQFCRSPISQFCYQRHNELLQQFNKSESAKPPSGGHTNDVGSHHNLQERRKSLKYKAIYVGNVLFFQIESCSFGSREHGPQTLRTPEMCRLEKIAHIRQMYGSNSATCRLPGFFVFVMLPSRAL